MIPGSANPLLLAADAAAGGYSIARSLRFNSADSASLSRTFGSGGNRRTWTLSAWIKRSAIAFSAEQHIWGVTGTTDATYGEMFFGTGDTLRFAVGYNTTYGITTTRVFRDPSAWYHIVLAFDATQSTAANKIRLYVNGVEETAFSSDTRSSLANQDWGYNNNVAHYIGRNPNSDIRQFNGYLADVWFIDGQQLTPSSFGESDATTGVWNPKAYTGSVSGNSFHLTFEDNSSNTASTLGKDVSGLGNNWTPSTTISVTAGAGNDSVVDSPTNGSASSGGDAGGTVVGNYATFNPTAVSSMGIGTLANGNLDVTYTDASNWQGCVTTVALNSGKFYWEYLITGIGTRNGTGIVASTALSTANGGYAGYAQTADGFIRNSTVVTSNNANAATGLSSYTTNDILNVAIDFDAGKIWFGKNGTWESSGNPGSGTNATVTFTPGGKSWYPCVQGYGTSCTGTFNAGARPFAYAAPSGFKSLNTANLPASTILNGSNYFGITTRMGTGSAGGTVTGLNFTPDLIWEKPRNVGPSNHYLFDVIRGLNTGPGLKSNATDAESSVGSWITGPTSTGYTVNSNDYGTTVSVVGWCWDAGTSTVTNTQGSITSTVRANTSAGFSIVTYTGNGTSGATVGHGLGVTPSMIIIKSRSLSVEGWNTYHASLTAGNALQLNSTQAQFTGSPQMYPTAPGSSVFTLGTNSGTNSNGATYVAYCFSPVSGYSSFGSFSGGANPNFIYLGFRPRYVMIKRTDTTNYWIIQDAARNSYNQVDLKLAANASVAENDVSTLGDTTQNQLDFVSNGFVCRSTNAGTNASGGTYIYCAWAENPVSIARAR